MAKVLIGMSWGVDSAVAAYLLIQQWHEVTAWFMKNYVSDDGNCTTYNDAEEAIRVANFLWIKIISFDLQQEYNDKIIEYIYQGYKQWITPNPDVLCNSLIKFDVFLQKALTLWFDYIATGHYARIEKQDNRYVLLRGKDYNKDQSYFLSWLNQWQLAKALFPIGSYTKPEIRTIAQHIGLPNAKRKDSQWLCFIGNIPIKKFLAKRLPVKKGNIIDTKWNIVGTHEGAYFFTIGQRHGLQLPFKAYVIDTDVQKNTVTVGEKSDKKLFQKNIVVTGWHRIGKVYTLPMKITAKIRYRQEPQEATLTQNKQQEIIVKFKEKQRAIAPGQTLTAYQEDECIGSGIISK